MLKIDSLDNLAYDFLQINKSNQFNQSDKKNDSINKEGVSYKNHNK